MALNSYVVHNIGENGKWTGALQTYCTHKKKVSFFPLCTAVLSFFLVRVHHRAFFSTRSMVLFIYSQLVFTVLYIRLINLKRTLRDLAGTKNSSWTDRPRKSGRFEIKRFQVLSTLISINHIVRLISIKRADKHKTAFAW